MAKLLLLAVAQLFCSLAIHAATPPLSKSTTGLYASFSSRDSPVQSPVEKPSPQRLLAATDVPPEKPNLLDDFYTSVHYDWMKQATPPDGTWTEMRVKMRAQRKTIINKAARKRLAGQPTTLNEQIVGDWYLSGIDAAARKKDGINALKGVFATIAKVKNKGQLAGKLARQGIHILCPGEVLPMEEEEGLEYLGFNGKPRNVFIMYPDTNTLVPVSIGEDYFVADCVTNKDQCDAAMEAVTSAFTKAGDSPALATENAKLVFKAVRTLLPIDVPQEYRSFNVSYFPGFDAAAYLRHLGVSSRHVAIWMPESFRIMGKWLTTAPAKEINALFRWRIFLYTQDYLEDSFSSIIQKIMAPEKVGMSLKKRVESYILDDPRLTIGLAHAQLYSDQMLPPKTMKAAEALVEAVRSEYRRGIGRLTWMTNATKSEARKRLDISRFEIGTPKVEVLKDLNISRTSYLGNGLQVMHYRTTYRLNLVRTPPSAAQETDPRAIQPDYVVIWDAFSTIRINAGLLQPPLFNPKATDEFTFGAMGMIISFANAYTFGPYGHRYNWEGVLKDWWTPADNMGFFRIAVALITQYNNYTLHGMPVNGTNTVVSNFNDVGGLANAYGAWNASRTGAGLPLCEGVSHKRVPASWKKFSPQQRFFLSFAQVFKGFSKKEVELERLTYATDAPYKFRLNGPLSNLGAFYTAFNLTEGFQMYREPSKRISIWS